MNAAVANLNALADAWAPMLWQACWQGGLALLLAMVLSRWTPAKIPARVRCWAWRLAFFKLFVAGLWIVPVELRVLPPAAPAAIENAPNASAERPAPAVNAHQPAPASNAVTRPSGLGWLLITWIVGVAACLANQARHWAQARRMIAGLAPVTDPGVLQRLGENCRRLGAGSPPELRVSEAAGSPYLVGMWRPIVVLPSVVLDACSTLELDAALAHEVAHVKRRDLAWNCLPALAEVVYFFHPLVWLAKREWRLTQEVATDELAISGLQGDVALYAQSLVELVARCPTVANCPRHAVCVSEAYAQLKRRMIAMQAYQPFSPRRRLAFSAILLAIAACGIAPWKLTAQANEPPSQPAADDEQATRAITIHVVDEAGQPMKGVKVFRNHVYKLAGEERPKIENKDYFTDADGKAVVALSGVSVDLRLWVRLKNFVPLHAMWAKSFQSDGDQIPREFTFTLKPGTEIGGVVKNDKGEPIEGVMVEIMDESALKASSLTNVDKPGTRPVRLYWLADEEEAVFTDAQGRWSLGTVASDADLGVTDAAGESPLFLRISHPDYASSTEPERAQRVTGISHKALRDKSATIVMQN